MDTITAIEKRRSIRKFKSDDIDKEIVLDILNCGRLAPSAKNRQPWHFVVVKNTTKDKIADMMIDFSYKQLSGEIKEKIGYKSSVNPSANVIKQAPILVLVFNPKKEEWSTGDNLSIGACIENMCLRAVELNLGTLWIRDIYGVAKDVAKMLGYQKMELNSAVAIGYPDESPFPRPRKALKEIIDWIE